jgi:hypothetical protein
VKAKAANTNNPIANRLVFFMLVSFPDLASSLTRLHLVMRRREEKGVMTRTTYLHLLTFALWLLYRLPAPVPENGIPKEIAS